MEQISFDEYKILKQFIEIPNHTMSQTRFDELYTHESNIRISAVRLISQLNFLEYVSSKDEYGNIIKYDKTQIQLTPAGRFAFKLYEDDSKKERRRFVLDKTIPFLALIVSIVSLLKSYGCGIEDFFTWCMQLLGK